MCFRGGEEDLSKDERALDGGGVAEDHVNGAKTVIDGANPNTCLFSSSIYTKTYIKRMVVISCFIFFSLFLSSFFLLSDRGGLEREIPA